MEPPRSLPGAVPSRSSPHTFGSTHDHDRTAAPAAPSPRWSARSSPPSTGSAAPCSPSCTRSRRRWDVFRREAIPVLADELNLSRADVHGVVTLLPRLPLRARRAHHGAHLPRRGVPGASAAERLVDHLRDRYGMSLGETSRDGVADRGAGLLPRQLRAGPRGAGRRPAARPGRRGDACRRLIDAAVVAVSPVTAPVTVYVPGDSAARSVGADEVAEAVLRARRARQGRSIRLVRNGSRGMLWLEPLVEVVDARGPDRLRAGRAGRRRRPGGRRACSTAASTARGSAWSTTCPGWRRRTGSPSPASASSTRCRPRTTSRTAASSACGGRWR